MALYGPKRRKTISTLMSIIGMLSGLILLTLSFVGRDPKADMGKDRCDVTQFSLARPIACERCGLGGGLRGALLTRRMSERVSSSKVSKRSILRTGRLSSENQSKRRVTGGERNRT